MTSLKQVPGRSVTGFTVMTIQGAGTHSKNTGIAKPTKNHYGRNSRGSYPLLCSIATNIYKFKILQIWFKFSYILVSKTSSTQLAILTTN